MMNQSMIDPQDIRVTSYLPQSGYGAGGMSLGINPSGIIVHHIPTGIGISCDSERSQWANKEKAIGELTRLLNRHKLLAASTACSTDENAYCSEGDACVCGGDLPAIREGCYNWRK